MNPLCLMESVTKTFRIGNDVSIEVLKGIDLSVDEGDFIAIMGTSGSGKSTLMHLIGCLDVPTSGRYLLAGREVLGLLDDDLSELRNTHIGFVFQSFYLLPYATVLENVLLPTLYREKAGSHVERHAVELLHLVGLEERMHFRPNRLSGGEQQRVALCRALMNDPEIILADEPTGQLDSKTASEIMSLLAEMNKKGKTVILVTHDPGVASYANKIIQIKDGVIINESGA